MSYTFPEDNYRPLVHPEAYRARVMIGAARARHLTAAVCALARDLGDRAAFALAGIDAIAGLFAASRSFVYENDSADFTAERVQAWQAADPARRWARCDRMGRVKWQPVRSGVRGAHMAEYRNILRDAALADPAFGPDVVVMLDSDLAGWSLEGLCSTLGTDGWDAVAANGLKTVGGRVVQYDAWAWRDVDHPHAHAAREINPRVYDRGHPMVPVGSAFGGLAVYRAEALAAACYAGGDCEHAVLHRALADAGYGRIFVNPGQVVVYA
jgi:hypothetical protein